MSTGAPLKSALKSQVSQAGNVGEVKTVAHAAQFCVKSFNHCLMIAGNIGPKELALIQNQRGRLYLWISDIGVFAPDHASIDHRLQYVPDTHQLIKSLVEVLNDSLQMCIHRLETLTSLVVAEPEALDKKRETAIAEFEAVVQRVSNDISLLYQLSNTIRRAGRESQNSKANSLFEMKDAEGNNIEKILEARFLHNLTDQFPACDEQLRQRLAATVLLRRKRILYRRSRGRKGPPTVPEPKIPQSSGAERSMTPVEVKQQETGPAEIHTLNLEPSMVQSQARTAKTTTTLDPERLQPPTASSVLSVAKTIPLYSHDDLVFPPPPRAAILQMFRERKNELHVKHKARLQALPNYELYEAQKGRTSSLPAQDIIVLQTQIQEAEKDLQIAINTALETCKNMETEVVCPYCLCTLSSADMKSEGKWRNHLRGDLDAYVCLFLDCENPCELFNHSETWLKHMRQHAVRWQCMAKSHGPQTFEQREEYEWHLREAHEGAFSDSQILVMADRNARMMGPLFQSCPLCGVTKDCPGVTGRLEDHVVGHLRYLALVSLPYIEEEEQKTNSTNSLRSNDSAKPADRSTVRDLLDRECDFTPEGSQPMGTSGSPDFHLDEDPYDAWNGIENYVRASHTLRPGGQPQQIAKLSSDSFSPPVIRKSEYDDEPYLQQPDNSSHFFDAHDVAEGLSDRRGAQWGWIPTITIPYEGQEADPILQGFRRHAVSNTLATESIKSRVTSSGSVSPVAADMPSKFDILQDRVIDAFVVAEFPENVKKNIVPSDIVRWVDESTISSILYPPYSHTQSTARGDDMGKDLSDFILKAPKLFLICVYIGLQAYPLNKAMQGFKQNMITDDHLPITKKTAQQVFPLDRARQRFFIDYQSMFLGLILPATSRFSRIEMGREEIFPFKSVSKIADGEFGTVWQAVIHGSFLDPKTPKDSEVALKRVKRAFREDTPRAWEREIAAIQAISNRGLRHFIRVNSIISRGQERFLVFPWANGGNLMKFWEANDAFHQRRSIAQYLVPEIMRQLSGLAEALLSIHEFPYQNGTGVYRHGDLKPENILIFERQIRCGTWTMADLGLAQFHVNTTNTRELMKVSATSTAGWGTTSYQPPETARQLWAAKHNRNVPPISPLYDIWSMGCIILQLIVWLIYGMEEIRNLNAKTRNLQRETSTFYTEVETLVQGSPELQVSVHHEVEKLMERMREHLKGSWVLLRLLEVVQENLLVVPLPEDSTLGEAGCRMTASGLRSSLREISYECDRNHGLWQGTKDLVRYSTSENPPGAVNRGREAFEGNNASCPGPNIRSPDLHMNHPNHSNSLS